MSEQQAASLPQIQIRPLQPGEGRDRLQDPERRVDRPLLTLEPKDRESWAIRGQDPEARWAYPHGLARHQAVGCVALIPMGNGVYELSKWRSRPEMRGWDRP